MCKKFLSKKEKKRKEIFFNSPLDKIKNQIKLYRGKKFFIRFHFTEHLFVILSVAIKQRGFVMGKNKSINEIDWNKIASFLRIGASLQEVAYFYNISVPTLQKLCKQQLGMSFGDFKNKCFTEGNLDLRKVQHELALKGNVQLLIWLGKNRLNQTDKLERTELGERKIELSVVGENSNENKKDENCL